MTPAGRPKVVGDRPAPLGALNLCSGKDLPPHKVNGWSYLYSVYRPTNLPLTKGARDVATPSPRVCIHHPWALWVAFIRPLFALHF